jgi:hypothetical protein
MTTPLPPPLPARRPDKAAHAEIRKHQRHPQRQQKPHVRITICSRPMHRSAQLPGTNPCRQGKHPKEHPRKLQPEHPGESHKRPPDRLPKPLPTLLDAGSSLLHLRLSLLHLRHNLRPDLRHRRRRRNNPLLRRSPRQALALHHGSLRRRIRSRSRIHRSHHRLRRQASPNPQHPSKPYRIHTGSVARPPRPSKRLDLASNH